MEKHRLSAIMFTDIVGYTRKMGEDEVRMLKLLEDHDKMVVTAVDNNDGEIVKRIGDAFLMNFDSAQNAVLCAIDIQQAHSQYNREKSLKDQVLIRIGIHLGDIIIREEDVFGDGVNVASRIEPLAYPGGICITRSVYDMVKKKMDISAVELGPQQLKNVDEAVEVYHLLSDTVGIKELRRARRLPKRRINWKTIYIALAVIAIVITLIVTKQRISVPVGVEQILKLMQNVEVTENSVAVLPLRNLTGSIENQYLCEGMSEDLIFRLSRVQGVYIHQLDGVLAISAGFWTADGMRNALGAKYMVKGSLQLFGDSLLVQWEVIETEYEKRLFSKRYGETVSNRLRLQELVARDVLYQVVGRVSGENEAALAAYSSSNTLANDLYLQARKAQREAVSWEDQQRVLKLYESVIELDSGFALARAHLAEAYARIYGEWQNDTTWVTKARKQAETAVALAPDLPEAYFVLGKAREKGLCYAKAEAAYFRAIKMRPDYPAPHTAMAELYWIEGKQQESVLLFKQSLELTRDFGDRRAEVWALHNIGWRHHWLGDYDISTEEHTSSMNIAREIGDRKGEGWALYNLAMINFKKGDYGQALEILGKTLVIGREIVDLVLESYTLNMMAECYRYSGHFMRALKYYKLSLEIAREVGNYSGVAIALNNIGCINTHLGNAELAQDFNTQGIKVARDFGDPLLEVCVLKYLAEAYMINGENENALECLTKALTINEKVDHDPAVPFILSRLGNILYDQGHITAAHDTLLSAVNRISLESGDQHVVSLYLGACEVKLGDVEKGLNRIRATQDSLNIMPRYSVMVELHRVLGELLLDLGRKEEARNHLIDGYTMADTTGMKGELKRYDELLARLE